MRSIQILFAIGFICGYFQKGLCRISDQDQSELNADEDYQGDDYDYGDDYETNKSDESEVVLTTAVKDATLDPPYFEQTELELFANPGDDVMINCDVRNFHITNVVIWYKDTTVIATGQFVMNHRAEVMKNNAIRIKNVRGDDVGDYYCEIQPEKIRQHVSLKLGGHLAIFCDGRDVTDRSLTFRQGETHTFECKTYVPVEPKIKWSFNGQRAENVVTKVNGNKMYIDNIDAEHGGIYQCLGDDGSQEPLHGMVTIDVQYSPKVSTHRHHVNTEPGGNAELYCDYKANPIAVTHWLKSDQVVSYSDKYLIKNMEHKNRNRTVLTVKDVIVGDLGEYVCQVENSIGSNAMKVFIIYEPETPQFENMKTENNKVTLHWLVRSIQPLSEAVLDYKMTGAYTWSTVTVIHTQRHAENSGVWKVTHEMELMPGEWHTRVKTKNTMGWSKFSVQHDFRIEDQHSDMNDEIPPQDLVMAAGIGVGKSSYGSGQIKIGPNFIVLTSLASMLIINRQLLSIAIHF